MRIAVFGAGGVGGYFDARLEVVASDDTAEIARVASALEPLERRARGDISFP